MPEKLLHVVFQLGLKLRPSTHHRAGRTKWPCNPSQPLPAASPIYVSWYHDIQLHDLVGIHRHCCQYICTILVHSEASSGNLLSHSGRCHCNVRLQTFYRPATIGGEAAAAVTVNCACTSCAAHSSTRKLASMGLLQICPRLTGSMLQNLPVMQTGAGYLSDGRQFATGRTCGT